MNALVPMPEAYEVMETVLIKGDLAKLSPEERSRYYLEVCKSVGLNPLTKPFDYIKMPDRRLQLYALRACTDQLRKMHGVSVEDLVVVERDGCYLVTVKVRSRDGRADVGTGAVTIGNAKGDMLCNLLMKAETKAKRRATLSLCGLGWLDETEIETIHGAKPETPTTESLSAFARLRQEIDLAPELTELQEWGRDNADLIRSFPVEWREQLRSLYAERLNELRAAA